MNLAQSGWAPRNVFAKFLLSGAFNTIVTYALYLLLILVLPYWASYSIAFACGIFLSYGLNRRFVFGRALSGTRLLAFPLVYVFQYLLGLAITALWVEVMNLPAALAPLAALSVSVPVTFLLTKQLFRPGATDPAQAGTGDAQARLLWGFVLVPVLVVLLLWLPFGTALRGLIEEWDVLGLFTAHGVFYLTTPASPLPMHSIRPLTILPQAIAYTLDADSFTWWHVLLAAALVAKGIGAGLLAWLLTRRPVLAMAAGALVLLYPADTMQLAFRSLHINMAVALVLLACAALVLAYDAASRARAVLLGVVASGLLAIAAFAYEAALALLPLPALVLLARDGLAVALARIRLRLELAAFWLAVPLAWLLHARAVAAAAPTYQATLAGGQLEATLRGTVPKLFPIAVLRALVGGWVDAARMFRSEYDGRAYLFVATALCCGAIAWFAARSRDPAAMTEPAAAQVRPLVRMALCGFLALLLGYAPYLISPAHVLISQRTYLFATPGAVMLAVAVLGLLALRARRIAAVLGAVLLLLGFAAQVFQFHHYVGISENQRRILRSIVENFDGELGDRTLLVLDGSNRLNHEWMLRTNLGYALGYLYGKPVLPVQVCLMPSHSWQQPVTGERPGECVEEGGSWRLRAAPPISGPGMPLSAAVPDRVLPQDKVVVVRIEADGSIAPQPGTQARVRRLATGDDVVARRYRGVLLPPSLPSLLQGQFASKPGSYRYDFGRWWSLEDPVHGSGWRESEWLLRPLREDAAAWSLQPDASLVFDVKEPGPGGVISGSFRMFASDAAREGLQFRLNGIPLRHKWETDVQFSADIPAGTIRAERNVLEILGPIPADHYGVGAMLSWIEVRTGPAEAAAAR